MFAIQTVNRRLMLCRICHLHDRSCLAAIWQGPLNAYFEALLETGVDEMTWDDVGDDDVSLVDCFFVDRFATAATKTVTRPMLLMIGAPESSGILLHN